jgi:hypothetical protein
MEFAKQYNLGMTAGGDSHYYKAIGHTYTEFNGNNEEDLKQSILNKQTKINGKKAPIIYIFVPLLCKVGILKK